MVKRFKDKNARVVKHLANSLLIHNLCHFEFLIRVVLRQLS